MTEVSTQDVLARIDALVARLDQLTEAMIENAAAMTAVADSHAQLLAALLAPEGEESDTNGAGASDVQDEVARTIALSQVIGG